MGKQLSLATSKSYALAKDIYRWRNLFQSIPLSVTFKSFFQLFWHTFMYMWTYVRIAGRVPHSNLPTHTHMQPFTENMSPCVHFISAFICWIQYLLSGVSQLVLTSRLNNTWRSLLYFHLSTRWWRRSQSQEERAATQALPWKDGGGRRRYFGQYNVDNNPAKKSQNHEDQLATRRMKDRQRYANITQDQRLVYNSKRCDQYHRQSKISRQRRRDRVRSRYRSLPECGCIGL